MSNLSQIKRQEMLDYINQLKEIHSDDESIIALNNIENALTEKKYGLVWEEHSEKVDEMLEHNIPVFTEIGEMKIESMANEEFNFLLEGDNLHSLKILEKTHNGKIDVIYIDPPYNTKNKEFIYDDCMIGKDDTYRHSKWISFMNERLIAARNLLQEEGKIIISIDDNEFSQLKLLCDEVFGEQNFVANLPTIMNFKGNQSQLGFAGIHEYTLVYAKNITKSSFNEFNIHEEELEKKWLEDEIGFYKKGATLKRTGNDAPREKRPTTFYPILIKDNKVATIEEDEYLKIYDRENKIFDDTYLKDLEKKYKNMGYSFILPIINDYYASWRWSIDTLRRDKSEVIITSNKDNINFYKKQRPELGEIPTKKPKTILYKARYSTGTGTNELKNILGGKKFDNPKSVELIKDLLYLTTNNNSKILDFFAGSGTTGHAVAQLNKEDGGNRKYILCTNNENKIAEEITYQRLKNIQEDLPHNLKYYKTDFIKRFGDEEEILSDRLLSHIKEMVELENMCEIDGKNRVLILSQEDLERWFNGEIIENSKVYLPSYILLSREIEVESKRKGIKFIDVPDYYFLNELREVNEL
ncbi:site-specific DNA-methyltransferase [Atopobacter phocae]|uniref:site-specific DNA-methyltransferase n=1 Tax=Atopobacter phocae TaxID=136492 RepID=UPI00046E6A08|nr:site-specific DNA-methyltransferase [Atopobacter phocae]